MAVLFSSAPGQVIRVSSAQATPLSLTVDRWDGFATFKSIITGFSVSKASNIQFTHTLRDTIYAYVFGEQVGRVALSGLAFVDGCGQSGRTGAESILAYYDRYRASRYGKLLTLQIGNSSAGRLRSFLTSLELGVTDPAQQLTSWTLTFRNLPDEAFRKDKDD